MEEYNDIALETLLSAREKVASELPEQLVQTCYEIQKRFQFEKDRSRVIIALEAAVNDWLNKKVEDNDEAER